MNRKIFLELSKIDMEANNQLAGDLFGDMVLEQAIKDKTEMMQEEMMAAQQAEVEAFGLN